jgi:uncharacterized protein (UPF0332 family)
LESSRALLLLRDLAPKTHKGIGMKLGQVFREQVDVGLLKKLRQNREEVDYRLQVPDAGEVECYMEKAERFIEAATNQVEEE